MNKRILTGILAVVTALIFGIGSLKYPIGEVRNMGPGFFPLMLSSIMMAFGILNLVIALWIYLKR